MDGEKQAIARYVDGPMTARRILEGLAALGVRQGDALLVHASLSSFGFVAGGAQAVVEALIPAVGPRGLLVMPTFTSHLSDPCFWRNPPVPGDWWPVLRAEAPGFDPAVTPSRGIGCVSELLRTFPGALRGPHPHLSFAAWGEGAHDTVFPHAFTDDLGPGSPLQRLYDRDAKVLFLGTDYSTCTAFHLGEHKVGRMGVRRDGAPVLVEGVRQWVKFESLAYETEAFGRLGEAFEAAREVAIGRIGGATCRLFSVREAVDFAETWLCANGEAG